MAVFRGQVLHCLHDSFCALLGIHFNGSKSSLSSRLILSLLGIHFNGTPLLAAQLKHLALCECCGAESATNSA